MLIVKFDVLFLEEAKEFLRKQDEKVRSKIIYNIDKSRYINDPKLFKKITNSVWEFRTKHHGIQYRLFAFWDNSNQKTSVISTHGMIKKSNKVPKAEIEKTEQIRKLYIKSLK